MYSLSKMTCAIALAFATVACSPSTEKAPETVSAASQALPSGVTLVKVHQGQANAVAIPYKKYQLSNGLTVIVHEDHSDPLVHVDVTYHVGSAREEIGKSGFAHFFEHMMFQSSEHVADEQHFQIITEAGGEMNGSVSGGVSSFDDATVSETLHWPFLKRFTLPVDLS